MAGHITGLDDLLASCRRDNFELDRNLRTVFVSDYRAVNAQCQTFDRFRSELDRAIRLLLVVIRRYRLIVDRYTSDP